RADAGVRVGIAAVGGARAARAAAAAGTFDGTATVPGPGEVAGWLATRARTPGRSGLAASGQWGGGTGHLTGLAIAAPGGACAFIDPTTLTQDDDQALAGWLADPGPPNAPPRAQGPIHALAPRRLA